MVVAPNKQYHRPQSRRWSMWRWFVFMVVVFVGHYCYCFSRISISIVRNSDANFTAQMDQPTITRSQHTVEQEEEDAVGILTCLSDRDSVMDVLAMVQSLQEDWEPDFVWEIYHAGTLSRFLQGHLESSSFVTVVDISTFSNDIKTDNDCLETALKTTKMNHILVTKSASVHFLQDPNVLLAEMAENQKKHCENEPQAKKFISSFHHKRTISVEDGCFVPLPPPQQTIHIQHVSPDRTMDVATLYEDAWMDLEPSYRKWVNFNEFFKETFVYSDGQIHSEADDLLRRHWGRQWEARRLVLMDRPVAWVAFDAGFHADDSATLNTLRAAERSLHAGTKILNVDVALTKDKWLVAVHNDKSITPADFRESQLVTSLADLNAKEALALTNPCLPRRIVKESLLPSPYQGYNCQPEPVKPIADFVHMMTKHNKLKDTATPTEMILDLKAPKVSLQIDQARILAKRFARSLPERQLAVRFFSVIDDDRLAATVFPEEALQALATDPSLEGIAYYVNVPSSVACMQLAAWIENHPKFENKLLQGCYVILGHQKIAQSWVEFAENHYLNTTAVPASVTAAPKMICDVPRKKSFRDPSLWLEEYNHCLSEGFDYIHDPFPPSSHVDTSRPEMAPTVPNLHATVREVMRKRLDAEKRKPEKTKYGKKVLDELMHFGYGLPADWNDEQGQWYAGPKFANPARVAAGKSLVNVRCVTKVLSVMLFLKFQEMGYLDIDDLVVDGSGHTYPVTFRQVFSNTGIINGTFAREDFIYGNDQWYFVPSAFERLTGLNFVDAVTHHIIQPMGLQGYYDRTNVTLPPFAGRGYNGHPSDLLVIGGTLASGGVSPKTRKQILSVADTKQMLATAITTPPLEEGFSREKIAVDMNRIYNKTGFFHPSGVSDGYGMGVWTLKGWRYSAQGKPVTGWLAQGSGMVYFDTTGLTVSYFPRAGLTARHVRAFAAMVRDVGDYILESMPGATSREAVQ